MPGGSFWEKWTVLAKREEKERKIAEENKKSKELSEEYGFPNLTGTENK